MNKLNRLYYLAGLFDGEGSAGVYWHKNYRGNKTPIQIPKISLSMTDKLCVQFFQKEFNTKRIYKCKKEKSYYKQRWEWCLACRKALVAAKKTISILSKS